MRKLILLLILVPFCFGGLAHVADDTCQQICSSCTSGTSAALSTNPTAGNTLYVGLRIGGGTPAPTVTVTSSPSGTWAQDVTANANSQGAGYVFAFSSSNVTGGSTTISVSFTGLGATSIRMCAMEASGLTNSSQLDKTASNVGNSGAPSSGATATTTVADEFVYGVVADTNGGSNTFGAGSGFTLGTTYACSSGQCLGQEWKIVSATGTQTCTFTDSANNAWGATCSTYKIASGGGGTVAPRCMLLGVCP